MLNVRPAVLSWLFPSWLFPLIFIGLCTSCSEDADEGPTEPPPKIPVIPAIEGMQAYFPLDGHAEDWSGGDNHGTVHGAEPTEDRFGNEGCALHFDGKGDYIALSRSGIGEATHFFSVSLWFRTQADRTVGLFFEGKQHGPGILVRINPDEGKLIAHSNDAFTLKTEQAYNDGAWHHLVLSAAENEITVWVDGSLVAEGEWSPDFHLKDTAEPAVLGREGEPTVKKPGHYFVGDLDDVAIIHRPLSSKEIAVLFQSGPNQLPNAVPTAKVLGLEVKLDGSGSFDSDGEIVSWEWTLSDGSAVVSDPSFTHNFSEGGLHWIGLKVTDDQGATSEASLIVETLDPTQHTGGSSWPQDWAEWELDVLDLVNQRRAEGAVCGGEPFGPAGPAEVNHLYRISSRLHSEDMAKNAFFAHTNLNGATPFDRMAAAGYEGPSPWGENIAAGQTSPAGVMDGWMNSPGHCRNIMNPSYEVLGVGYYYLEGSSMGHYWTQNFGGGH